MARFSLLSNLSAALFLFASSCVAAEGVALRNNLGHERKLAVPAHRNDPYDQYRFLPPLRTSRGDDNEDLELLDICLVASIDGKFHALNRTSGQILWSTTSTSASVAPAALAPLVRTQHIDPDDGFDDGEHKEYYIIEPQTGNIFVLPSADAPLQRLPFSVPQLVDLSPFSFSGDEEHRVFVGKKETSLLRLELETGRLKGIVSSECPWDPFGDLFDDQTSADLDLDELDGTKPMKEKPESTEVLIGRTDYHVSIHTRLHNRNSPRPPVQNLTFSVYGPNNQDLATQSTYRRTPDDIYVQPTPNGEILTFKAAPKANGEWRGDSGSRPLWGHSFKTPVVAVFDILRSPSRQQPLALLQPQPRLYDVLPNLGTSVDNNDAPYIGVVDASGSLFAMTPETFPLVVFQPLSARGDLPRGTRRTIDAPPGEDLEGVDTFETDLSSMCEGGNWDRRCLVGRRPIEASDQSRLSRLLPDPESVAQSAAAAAEARASSRVSDANASGAFGGSGLPPVGSLSQPRTRNTQGFAGLGALAAFGVFLVGLWYLKKQNQPGGKGANHWSTGDGLQSTTLEHVNGSSQPDNAEIKKVDFASKADTAAPRVSFDVTAKVPEEPSPTEDKINISQDAGEEGEGDEDPERESGDPLTPGKKKGTRRKGRGRKGKGVKNMSVAGPDAQLLADEKVVGDAPLTTTPIQTPTLITSSSTQSTSQTQQLIVSDEILGFGSHGTVVYKGSLQGRAVAVKRLLQDFVTLAEREVNILQESDYHPNVIRYYYQESHANFLYIALELCPASLADVIERPDLHREISNSFDPKRALVQITSGLRHLHALKIIHRDIKPQNILISAARKGGSGAYAGHRMLISDFGLCRKLDVDQTSFMPTAYGAHAAGTVGWRAPEILRGDVRIDESAVDDASQTSRSSTGTATNGSIPGRGDRPARLTKSVDIFALGCLYFYTLTGGEHPYGDRYEREMNILKDAKGLNALEALGEEGLEAIDLIAKMLDPEASQRPDTSTCLIHPFFWNPARRLSFLQDASDRFEIMCRDPRDPDLIELEKDAYNVVGNDWQARLDRTFLDNLGKFRKYDGKSVQDLMRALRNKKHHYQDLPDNVKRTLGPLPDGFLLYFTRRFPHLFMHVHDVISRTNLRNESMFRSYFELTE